MEQPIEIQKESYTEYIAQLSSIKAIVQVPDDPEMPIQIILNTGNRSLILKLPELKGIWGLVIEALNDCGRIEEIK